MTTRNKIFIDDVDVYEDFGVSVTEGGFKDLAQFPPLKAIDKNDWQEYDGIEPDLSNPVLNSREIQIPFYLKGSTSDYQDFLDLLSDGAYHTVECLGGSWRLRLTQATNLKIADNIKVFTLKFAEDDPLEGYTYVAPSSTVTSRDDFKIDNKKFTDYGVTVLEGSLAEVLKGASVKQNLLRNIETQSGVIYDGNAVTYQAKDVKLNCLMRASNLTQLWRNHKAFLYDLIRPNERTLLVSYTGSYKCHYKSCSVKAFYPFDKIWLEFTLTLTFTRDFR